jgi:hypothetical protein
MQHTHTLASTDLYVHDFAGVDSVVEAGPHIYSFDNYNNAIASYIARSDKGAYQGCNWCGVTLKKLMPATDLELVYDEKGEIVPAMPKSLFKEGLWEDLMVLLESVDKQGVNYYKISMKKKYNVRCCPPKPKVTDAMKQDMIRNWPPGYREIRKMACTTSSPKKSSPTTLAATTASAES